MLRALNAVLNHIASSLAMRSAVGGCVENNRIRDAPVNGWMMNKCAVEGVASIGSRFEEASSFCNAEISLRGFPVYLAEAASASYSRLLEIAI